MAPRRLRHSFFAAALLLFAVMGSLMLPAVAQAAWPLSEGSDVGVRYLQHYICEDGSQHAHHGIDCLGAAGSQVRAPAAGTVSFIGAVPSSEVPGSGTQTAVSVALADGRTYTLMPFESVSVTEGQVILQGQAVGLLAATGDKSSAQPHLHVGLKRGSVYFDPSELLGLEPAAEVQEKAVEAPAPLPSAQAAMPSVQEQEAWAWNPQAQGAQEQLPVGDASASLGEGSISSGNVRNWNAIATSSQATSEYADLPMSALKQALSSLERTRGNMGQFLKLICEGDEGARLLGMLPCAVAAACAGVLAFRHRRRGEGPVPTRLQGLASPQRLGVHLQELRVYRE